MWLEIMRLRRVLVNSIEVVKIVGAEVLLVEVLLLVLLLRLLAKAVGKGLSWCCVATGPEMRWWLRWLRRRRVLVVARTNGRRGRALEDFTLRERRVK